jgi:hypothetical protein
LNTIVVGRDLEPQEVPMSAQNRPDESRRWFHVSQRGSGTAPVFGTDERREIFLEALAHATRRTDVEIHAFAVLPRRYHLLVRATDQGLIDGTRHWIHSFTDWVYRIEGGERPLLAAMSQREEVATQDLADLLADIHYAPVAKGMSEDREHYLWTSYLYYIGEKQCPTWLTVRELRDYVSAPVSIDVAVSEHSIQIHPGAPADSNAELTPLFGIQVVVDAEGSSVSEL